MEPPGANRFSTCGRGVSATTGAGDWAITVPIASSVAARAPDIVRTSVLREFTVPLRSLRAGATEVSARGSRCGSITTFPTTAHRAEQLYLSGSPEGLLR